MDHDGRRFLGTVGYAHSCDAAVGSNIKENVVRTEAFSLVAC